VDWVDRVDTSKPSTAKTGEPWDVHYVYSVH
jgi:hypothetical protein